MLISSLVLNSLQPANLSKYYGLKFVTSSAEKTELALKAEVSDETKPKVEEEEEVEAQEDKSEVEEGNKSR